MKLPDNSLDQSILNKTKIRNKSISVLKEEIEKQDIHSYLTKTMVKKPSISEINSQNNILSKIDESVTNITFNLNNSKAPSPINNHNHHHTHQRNISFKL